MALRTNANVLVIDQLKSRLQAIEAETGGDCVLICSPIRFGLDIAVRDALDGLTARKRRLTVVLETSGGSIEVTQSGLIPVFRTESSTIFVFRKVRNDVEEQAYRGTDDRRGEADGSRPEG